LHLLPLAARSRYNSACDAACSALGTIGPEDVLRAFQEMVANPNRRPKQSERVSIVDNRLRNEHGDQRIVSEPKRKAPKREWKRLAAR